MRDIFPFVFGRDFAELDQLFRLRVKRRWINQRCADPKRARLHFLGHQLTHLLELLRCRSAVIEANDVLANGRRANERGDIAGGPAFFEILQIFRQGIPFDLVFDVRLLL